MKAVKIEGFKNKMINRYEYRTEEINLAITKWNLREYFDFISNHTHIPYYIFTRLKNAVLFHCSSNKHFLKINFAFKIIKVVYIKTNSWLSGMFYDDQDNFVRSLPAVIEVVDTNKKIIEVIKINIDERFAGYYIINRNILLATDWTHCRSDVENIAKVWDKIVEELNIKRVDEYTEIADSKTDLEKTAVEMPEDDIEITVGCDPEFEIWKEGNEFVPADMILKRMNGKIGYDGAGAPLELRPEPGNPDSVVNDMKRLWQIFRNKYPGYDVYADGNRTAIGGHIHIGFSGKIVSHLMNSEKRDILDSGLIKMLDDFLGVPTLELSGTARGSYKKTGAYEIKPWGFEYRTPPALIFATPDIARISLKIAKNVTDEFFKQKEITYNIPVTMEDYMRIAKLTKEEAEIFKDFITSPHKYKGKSVIYSWTGKEIKKQTLYLVFKDEWNSRIKTAVEKAFRSEFCKKREKKITIVLYGLKESRGMVSTIGFADIEKLPPDDRPETHPNDLIETENGIEIHIGIPFIIRNNWEEYSLRKDLMIGAIKAEVKRLEPGTMRMSCRKRKIQAVIPLAR